MKSKFILLASATTLSCLPVFADQLGDTNNNSVNTVPTSAQTQRDRDEYQSGRMDHLGTDLRKANKIIGEEVTDEQGNKLGKVKDLAIDLQNGRIVEVIMETGGVLGVHEKLVAIPPSSFKCDKTMNALRLDTDKEQLKNAPAFEMSDWNNSVQRDQVREVYQRYGAQPYFVTGQPNDWRNNTTGSASYNNANGVIPGQGQTTNNYSFPNDNNTPHTQRADNTQNTRDSLQSTNGYVATGNTPGQGQTTNNYAYPNQNTPHTQRADNTQNTRDSVQATNGYVATGATPNQGQTTNNFTYPSAANDLHVQRADNTVNTRDNVQDNDRNRNENRSRDYALAGSNYQPVQMGSVIRASRLMGTEVLSADDQKLGKVNNFIVDLPAGRIVEVVLSSGGFLGMDAVLVPVPPQSFQWNADNTAVTLNNVTPESLKTSPHFKNSEWGYANEPANVTEVYSTYHVPAYFNNEVDNTRQNVRDRSGQTITPMNQGNNRADIDTTAQIRKAIMRDSSLSTNAKNVKIITNNGQVTLRGVVDSESEKQAIADAATRAANGASVDNQIEVRNSANSADRNSTDNSNPTPSTDNTK